MNQAEFAKHIGVSQPRVVSYIKNGKLKESITKNGRFYDIDPEIAKRELGQNLDPIKSSNKTNKNKKTSVPPVKAGMDYSVGRAVDQQYKAGLRKLEYEIKRGKLIEADQVRKDADKAARLVKEKVNAWPGRVSALVAAEDDQFKCEQILKKECNELLDEISEGL